MKRWKKTFWSLLLGVCLLLSAFTFSAWAEGLIEGDYKYTVADGEAAIVQYLGGGGDVVVPSSLGGYPVTAIGDFAFDSCDVLVHLTVPDKVERLGEGAFMNCTRLTSVVLPQGLTQIPSFLFSGCFCLSEIVIPDSVIAIGTDAFSQCCALRRLVLPESIERVEDFVFTSCSELSEIHLPDNLTSIGAYAFAACIGLKSIDIPVSVAEIDPSAFCRYTQSIPEQETYPIEGLTIYGYAHSQAEQYAWSQGISFVTIVEYTTETPGDIDGDGNVNASDALLALQHSVRLVDLRGDSLEMADIHQSSLIDAQDALLILQRSIGL